MRHTVYTVSPDELTADKKEIYRYLKITESDEEISHLVDSCINEVKSVISPKAVYVESGITVKRDTVALDFMELESKKLSQYLKDKSTAYAFVATLGIRADMTVNKHLKITPSRGVVINAVCIALIEDFCDRLTGYLTGCERSGKRFSPGYGDLKLEYQKELLYHLDAQRTVGVTLTDKYLMLPEKSVSAIVGAD